MLAARKGKIDSNTIIVGDFNTPLSPMDRSPKMKIKKETQALSDTKTRQRCHKERTLQANITDEHRCKNPQQNTSKQNPTAH